LFGTDAEMSVIAFLSGKILSNSGEMLFIDKFVNNRVHKKEYIVGG